MIEIKEVDIKEAIKVHKNIKEFNETKPEKEYFENRYRDREKLIIVAYYNNVPAGYIIGYDKFQDGKNFYCWMAGVDSKFRKLGILTKMMQYQENWAKQKKYNIIKIKTRNNRREMLSFLVKHNFNFLSVEKRDNIQDNRINLQKEI